MSMNPKVSIVMPAYNCEKYIPEATNSLLRQTYKNFELICVDDGSTDGTIEILRDYEKRDNRIQVVQQKNQYAGVARNNGMKLATGKYLMSLDADDVFEKNMLAYLVKKAEKSRADIVNFGYYKFKDNIKKRDIIRIPYHNRKVVRPTAISIDLFYVVDDVPWNKFYRTDFVMGTGLHFQSIKNQNDRFFTLMTAVEAERIIFLNKRFVNYRVNNKASLSYRPNSENLIKSTFAMYEELQKLGKYHFYKETFEDYAIAGCLHGFLKCPSSSGFCELCKRVGDLLKAMHISEDTPAVVKHPARKFWNSILNEDNNQECLFHFHQYVQAEYISKKSIEYRIGKKLLAILKLRHYS